MGAAYQETALKEVQDEYPKYFETLEQHPFALVGQTVPAIGREGTMVLGSTADARDWQEAVKGILAEEIRGRASKQLDENRQVLNTLHASVELFQRNGDLMPGTTGFDKDLADRFAKAVEPYELRVEGKLHGYTVPVQPIVDALRAQLQGERASAPAAPAAPAGGAAPAASAPAAGGGTPADQPQAGIASKAGQSSEQEGFGTLFGTIGLPNFQI